MRPFPIPFSKDVPLHHQIHMLLRMEILDGLYLAADDFPGELEVAEQFGVSVATSRVVLQRLFEEGLIDRGRGRKARALFRPSDILSLAPPTTPTFVYQTLSIHESTAPWEACRAFGLPSGSAAWVCTRLRMLDGVPHSVTVSFQPPEIGRRHDLDQVGSMEMPRLLARLGYPVLQIDRVVGVARAPPIVSTALGATIWDLLLLTTLIQRSKRNEPVEWTRIYYRSNQQQALETIVRDTGS